MAGQDSSQEKTEDATPKRLREARKKGQVAKSRDLNTVFVFVIVFIVIAFGSEYFATQLKLSMELAFGRVAKGNLQRSDLLEIGTQMLWVLVKVLGPILLAGVASGVMINMFQVGAIMSVEPIKPKLEKLNPIEGVKNMFKMVTFIELLKNIAKMSLVIFLAWHTIDNYMREILLTSSIRVEQSLGLTSEILYTFLVKVCVVFFIIALIDMAVQRWNFMKNMRMTKDEVKREYKEDEGDPQIKGERRRLHREMVFGDVKRNVKQADAVVSNPTHVAVAIKYDREEMAAPEVLVKGQRKFAEMILEIARDEGVPVIRNIPLAWSLLQVEEGDAIPEDLYEPVAEVLCLVYEMQENQASQTTPSPDSQPEPTGPSTFDPLG